MIDVRLYLVTGSLGIRSYDILAAAVRGGVTIAQARDKDDPAAMARIARCSADLGIPVLVNDDLDAATATSGLHVGPDDVRPTYVRERLGPDAIVGWSLHELAQLDDTAELAACDYVAVSPVWPTPTKPDTTPPWGLDGVAAVRAAVPDRLPVVGIGGIDASNAADVIAAGADGVCVVSAIWQASDPEAAARELRTVVDAALADRSAG